MGFCPGFYFLGLHRNAPTSGLQAEMGWMIPKYRYYILNLLLWNRLCCTNNTLTDILEWNLQNFSNNCWESHLNEIFNDLDIGDYFENGLEVNLVQITEKVKYFKILNINKSEVLMDQLSRVLTHVNVNMVINFTLTEAGLLL